MNALEKSCAHGSALMVLESEYPDRMVEDGGSGKQTPKRPILEEVFDDLDVSLEVGEQVKFKAPLPVCLKHAVPEVAATPAMKARDQRTSKCQQHVRNPWAVWTIADLFMLGGPLVSVFFIGQVVSAILLARAVAHLEMWDLLACSATTVWGFVLLDMVVFLLRRGRLIAGFILPAVGVSLATIVPGVCMQIWYYCAHWSP